MEDVGGSIEASLICRACLRIVEYKAQSYGYIEDPNGSLKDMLMCCVPEMDIYVSSEPIMCLPCIQFVVNLYNFKNRCINTESIIRSYIQRNNLQEYNHVNLSSVVDDLIQINKFQKEQHERILSMKAAMEGFSENSIPPHFLVPDSSPIPHSTGNFIEPPPLQPIIPQRSRTTEHNYLGPGTVDSIFSLREQNPFTAAPVQKSDVMLQQSNISSSEEIDNQESVKTETHCVGGKSVNPIECKLRLVVRIPRSQITIPLENGNSMEDKNEDSSEKENRQEKMEIPEITNMEEEPADKSAYKYDDINKIYNCSCMYLTTSKALFLEHKKKCKNRSNNLLKCPHCLHVTNRPYALSKHINTMHTKAVWFQCEFCTYRSTAKECLRRHQRKNHSAGVDVPIIYTCQVCGQQCSTESNLSKHMVKHSSSALSCDFCPYTSRDRSNFRKHIFTHNTRPLSCHACGYANVSPYQMRVHLKQRHNGVGVEEVDCHSDRPVSEIINDIKVALMEEQGVIDERMV